MNERDDMQLKRELDALPRAIEPPDDLWPGVRARLNARGTEAPGHRGTEKPGHGGIGAPKRAFRIAALLGLLAVSAGALAVTRRNSSTWWMETMARTTNGHDVRFPAGQPYTALSSQRIRVGTIGHVDLEQDAAIELVEARATQHRLALRRGTIHAVISAPPRLFVVETPSGTAVDMGCAYTLVVDSLGNSSLRVTAGWVSFEDASTRSLIPAGMHAVARKGAGIGTPVMDDAPEPLREAVTAFDATRADTAVGAVLRVARLRDAVTLWHLVQRTQGVQRERVVTKLLAMVPLPSGVTREAIARAEPHAMDLYWTMLPGTLPIVPSWQQTLWKLWLKVAG